jgi:RNA polymerase sigma-70 factor (ECF subfamily)
MHSVSRAEVRMARAAGESVQWPEREEAFKVFIGPRLDRAYGLARHLVGDHDAEDACQEALLTAWSAWPRLRDPARFEAWFDRILVNTCLELLRRRARRPQTTLSDDSGLVERDTAAGSADQDAMAHALGRLSPEHRATVVLRFWADLPTEAIAERLGVPPGTVRSRLHYALDALRADLGREVADD